MGKSVFLRQPHGPVDTRHFTAAIPTITAQDQELPLQLHCITLAASSTKIKVQNSCHGIQVHSRLGSIIPGITLQTNIILPWSVPSAIRHVWPTQLSSHED